LLKAVVAAWLVAAGIGVVAIGTLTFLKQGGVAAESERPRAHWSVPRPQESWSDEDSGRPLVVPAMPPPKMHEVSDAAI
jgi:hypothetical protein